MKDNLINYYPGSCQQIVETAWKKARHDDVAVRIWAKDYKLWSASPDEIVNRLGWLDAPGHTLKKTDYIRETIAPLADKKIKDVILLGMGGSGLAAEVFSKVCGGRTGYPRLTVLDTTHPAIISNIAQKIDWDKTIFIVSSKSGTTMEITSLFHFFYNEVRKRKNGAAGEHFVFITDEGSPLEKTARELSPFHVFLNNPDIGGRYSALSFFGIVPAAIIGMDVNKLLLNAQAVADAANETPIMLGAALGALACRGRDKLTVCLPPRWKSFGDWLEQLIAESTGKEDKGILPVLDEPYADVSFYAQDRLFVFFQNKNENSARIKDLSTAGHPVITVKIKEDFDLGSQMYIWEMATTVAAYFLDVNPFDQPDVESTKKHARKMIEARKKGGGTGEENPVLATVDGDVYGDTKGKTISEALNNFLAHKKTGDYASLQIYLNPSEEVDTATAKLRAAIFEKYRLPVTCNYGPRYLHSTGQLHKGGGDCGLFIQLTEENIIDLSIPDNLNKDTSSLSFGALFAAQAQGDFHALKEKGRRIIRIHCPNDATAFLKKLTAVL